MPINTMSVLKEVKNAIELNALPRDEIKGWIKGLPIVEEALKSGGMLMMIMIPLLILGLGVFGLLLLASKRYLWAYNAVEKIKKALFFNMFLRPVIVSYLAMCVSANYGSLWETGVEEKSFNFPVAAYLSAVITGCVGMAVYVEPMELEMSSTRAKFGTMY